MKLVYEFQRTLKAVEENPTDYKNILDEFTSQIYVAQASLGKRSKLVPNTYEEFLKMNPYKTSPDWIKKDLAASQFTLPGGKRTSYRGPNGVSLIENINSHGELETVEVIVERDLKDPTYGVAFFSYENGQLSDLGKVSFKGKQNISKVNSSYGCVSCHKFSGNQFSHIQSSVHPFGLKTMIHEKIANDMHPSSQKLE